MTFGPDHHQQVLSLMNPYFKKNKHALPQKL